MYARLAWRNVRSSARDYSIYILTLTIAVALFYAFSSVDAQTRALDIRGVHDVSALVHAARTLAADSLLVALLFAFLVVYANRFLLARRRREFGVLLALGMPAGRLASLLSLETAFLSLLALSTGLVLGLGLSFVLSYTTAALLGTTVANPGPSLSPGGLATTIASFLLVFALVTVGNIVTITRKHPTVLLSARPRTGASRRGRPVFGFAFLAVSLALFAAAARPSACFPASFVSSDEAGTALVLDACAAFALLAGLSHLAPALARRYASHSSAGLRSFTLRQLADRAGDWIALWLVAMTLLSSLAILSSGIADAVRAREAVPLYSRFDASAAYGPQSIADAAAEPVGKAEYDALCQAAAAALRQSEGDIARIFAQESEEWNRNIAESVQIDVYATVAPGEGLRGMPSDAELLESGISQRSSVRYIGVSQYNALARATGGEPLLLADDAFAIDALTPEAAVAAARLEASPAMLRLSDSVLANSRTTVRQPLAMTSEEPDPAFYLVVSDAIVAEKRSRGILPETTFLNVLLTPEGRTAIEASQGTLDLSLAPLFKPGRQDSQGMAGDFGLTQSASSVLDAWNSRILDSAYEAAYLGIVLLLVAAAVVSLRELSEAAVSARRYRTLAQLGANREDIERSLWWRIAVAFLAPLAVALLGIAVAAGPAHSPFLPESGIGPALAGTFVALYLVYMAATFALSKNVVRAHLRRPDRIS